MARTDTLGNFLTDVADAIREKKGTSETIQASDFDTEIANLPSGGDLSEYFNSNPESISSPNKWVQNNYLKKLKDIIVPNNVSDLSMFCGYTDFAPKIICNNNVTKMSNMYVKCTAKAIDVSGLNTENVNDMANMFKLTTNLESLDLSNFDTSKVTTMYGMFAHDYSTASSVKLTELDLSSFETPVLTNASEMFMQARKLIKIDMKNFDFTKLTSYSSMFGSNASSGPKDNCLIIVKDQTQKDWINTNFSRLTNVQTVAEYETSLNS